MAKQYFKIWIGLQELMGEHFQSMIYSEEVAIGKEDLLITLKTQIEGILEFIDKKLKEVE